MFIDNYQQNYSPRTVDGTLRPFRARVKFLLYMPKKRTASNFGASQISYVIFSTYNAHIYCWKGPEGIGLRHKKNDNPNKSVIHLIKGVFNINRNIIYDNWFTIFKLGTH